MSTWRCLICAMEIPKPKKCCADFRFRHQFARGSKRFSIPSNAQRACAPDGAVGFRPSRASRCAIGFAGRFRSSIDRDSRESVEDFPQQILRAHTLPGPQAITDLAVIVQHRAQEGRVVMNRRRSVRRYGFVERLGVFLGLLAFVRLMKHLGGAALVFERRPAGQLFAFPVAVAPPASPADAAFGRLGTVGGGLWVGTWSL